MDLFKGAVLFLPARLCAAIGLIVVVVLGRYNLVIGITAVVLFGVVFLFSLNQKKQQQWVLTSYLSDLEEAMTDTVKTALHGLPQQVILADLSGKIHWWNTEFEDWEEELSDSEQTLFTVLPDLDLALCKSEGNIWKFSKNNKIYLSYVRMVGEEKAEKFLAFYISDITKYEEERTQIMDRLPVLAHIQIDNYTEVLQGLSGENRTELLGEASRKLSAWSNNHHGVLKKVSEDSYLILFSQQDLELIRCTKVEILDEIRELEGGNKIPMTLSIGIAAGESTPAELNEKSQAALDLALGRGGDQAVLFYDGATQFFGGKSKAVERFTRVKARVVAQALRELIKESNKVIVMGHKQEDFDSIGAALGIARMSFALGKSAEVVLSSQAPDLNQLRTRMGITKEGFQDYFSTVEEALEDFTEETLVVVVDTHRPDSVASPEILEKAHRIVVIDHHRRTENFVSNPHLIYLEPSSSSTSELVTELITYLEERVKLTPFEVSMLYGGIILDTKNFVVQTGSRTLEAASYLRRNGANPQEVQKLFWLDIAAVKERAELISTMEIFEGVYAISKYNHYEKENSVIAAQAADEMSTLVGVRASFVLYPIANGSTAISARTQGDVNVQLIMESLGGGGHQMVAAVQLEEIGMEEALVKLKNAIMAYEKE
mgnify:FL=1